MVTLVKHEHHQVISEFTVEVDENKLQEIYDDLTPDEVTTLLEQIENGSVSVEEIVEDALNNEVDLDWDKQYDDWWTDRKGGYDVTYKLQD
jgi:hypothetical protein